MKSDLSSVFEEPLSKMDKAVKTVLLLLPPRIRNMRVADFLRESGGGDVQALLDKEKKIARCIGVLAARARSVSWAPFVG
jgi:hypothetical protein